MDDTAKYLIHADITADGVVERSDVVGAIFGQTEGLLGDELDLRDLQQSSKVGRIDVSVDSEAGQSFAEVTIATSLDKVETAVLAAALETITRVGPCRASARIGGIEDVRAAKRREVVDRARELLASAFDDTGMTSQELLSEVRQSVRVEDVTEYEGLPAGPRVEDSDAIVVVEGRADVLTLLRYGVKNAVAVEGTNVPDAVANLTGERTVTTFLDGDRGGDLILRELAQVGDVDYVAVAPTDRSVENLDRHEVMASLRDKVPYDSVADAADSRDAVAVTDGSTRPAPPEPVGAEGAAEPKRSAEPASPDPTETVAAARDETAETSDAGESSTEPEAVGEESAEPAAADEASAEPDVPDESDARPDAPETLRGHVREVVAEGSGRVRLLDAEFGALAEAPAEEAFDAVADADEVPAAVVLDGEATQRLLDVAAQRGVEQIVAAGEGEYAKQPTSVRVRTADQLLTAE